MKIILNLPNSASAFAAMLMADDFKIEDIEAAIKMCEDSPTEIDLTVLKGNSGVDESDLQAFNMGIALVAIGMRIDEIKKNKEDKK